ncbi:MAG: hypothetical protein CMJ29_07530 [Phycisphaerae bacterium]|nr:hypothetical protein [Phycisphaerae bacterium]MAT81479.1 hypothetical protein [Phycisphaerae bacterium]|tara:strand:- start:1820 stop:2509 length:690 start_codon:yes stop_codon:yes gene_type:complete
MAKQNRGKEAFPATQMTWITARLDEGEQGRRVVAHHLMEVYAEPLRIYLLGSSFRNAGEPEEIINGFFANRLSRNDYLEGWRTSDKRLRRWLINGLIFYIKEEFRRQKRSGAGLSEEAEANLQDPADHYRAFDQAWAASIVRHAMSEAAARCKEENLESHWDIFVRHHIQQQPYAVCCQDHGVDAARAAVMARTAASRFRDAVRAHLSMDGAEEGRIDDELADLRSLLQ